MQSVGYWQAWDLWWHGVKLENYVMWSLPLVWWSRIGKILQFMGGLAVVLDLIGSERLIRASNWSRDAPKRLARFVKRNYFDRIPLMGTLVLSLSALLIFGVMEEIARSQPSIYSLTDLFTGHAPNSHAVLTLFSAALWLGLIAGLLPFSVLLVRVILFLLAKIFGIGRRASLAKWVAFTLIAVGFHFDLLGG